MLARKGLRSGLRRWAAARPILGCGFAEKAEISPSAETQASYKFKEHWRKVAPNSDLLAFPSYFMASSRVLSAIPTKFTMNFVLPHMFEKQAKPVLTVPCILHTFSITIMTKTAASTTQEEVARGGSENTSLPLTSKGSPRVVFILGGPGSGKGTQCQKIVDRYGFVHLSAGDLLRAEIESGTENGDMIKEMIKDGTIVPSEVTVRLLLKAMEESKGDKFLIDGFPRNDENRAVFERMTGIVPEFILFFDCPEDEMERRVLGRNQGRVDDNKETMQKRLKVFVDYSVPVVKYYESLGKVHKVTATGSVDDIHTTIRPLFERFEHSAAVIARVQVRVTCLFFEAVNAKGITRVGYGRYLAQLILLGRHSILGENLIDHVQATELHYLHSMEVMLLYLVTMSQQSTKESLMHDVLMYITHGIRINPYVAPVLIRNLGKWYGLEKEIPILKQLRRLCALRKDDVSSSAVMKGLVRDVLTAEVGATCWELIAGSLCTHRTVHIFHHCSEFGMFTRST